MEEENGTLLLAFDLAGVKILFPFYCFSLSYLLLVDVHGFDLMRMVHLLGWNVFLGSYYLKR